MRAKVVTVEAIKLVARGLGDLNDGAVYVGGAVVPFYLPYEMQAAVRPTQDIDVLLEVIRAGNRQKLEAELREKGFQHDTSDGAPICRWKFKNLTVDIMSPDERVFGFTNKWFSEGVSTAQRLNLGNIEIKLLTLPYFLGTKTEAFKGRGNNDFMASPDMEDIIAILDGLKADTVEDIFSSVGPKLMNYLVEELSKLVENADFRSAVPGAIFDRVNSAARAEKLFMTTNKIVDFLASK